MRRMLLYSLVSVLMLAGEPAVGATLGGPGPAREHARHLRVLLMPLDLVVSTVTSWFRTPQPLPNATQLTKGDGWREVVLDVRDHAWGLMVEVEGAAEFGRSTILLADGDRLDLDFRGARRSNGLYSLADFGAKREVLAVGLRMRALGDRAFVGLRLARPATVGAAAFESND